MLAISRAVAIASCLLAAHTVCLLPSSNSTSQHLIAFIVSAPFSLPVPPVRFLSSDYILSQHLEDVKHFIQVLHTAGSCTLPIRLLDCSHGR